MSRKLLLAAAALAALWAAAPARAEHACPVSGTSVDGICPVTAGASSGVALNAYAGGSAGYRQIAIDNESLGTAIAVCFGASCTPALNTAGSYTIGAGQTRSWTIPYGSAGGFNDPVNIIAGAGSTPATVQAQ